MVRFNLFLVRRCSRLCDGFVLVKVIKTQMQKVKCEKERYKSGGDKKDGMGSRGIM